MLKNFNVNKFRLFIKGLVTVWVPVVVLTGLVSWSPELVAAVMASSVFTIDAFFAIFGVEDSVPPTNVVQKAVAAAKRTLKKPVALKKK